MIKWIRLTTYFNVLMKMNDSINFHENKLKQIDLKELKFKVLSDYKEKNKKKNDGQRKTALTMPVNITKEFAEFLNKDEKNKCQELKEQNIFVNILIKTISKESVLSDETLQN